MPGSLRSSKGKNIRMVGVPLDLVDNIIWVVDFKIISWIRFNWDNLGISHFCLGR